MQLLTHEKTITELCREHQLKDSLVHRWRDELLARGPNVYGRDADNPATGYQVHMAELERMVGRLTMELEVVKKASSLRSASSTWLWCWISSPAASGAGTWAVTCPVTWCATHWIQQHRELPAPTYSSESFTWSKSLMGR
jgi:transposase